VGKPFSGIAMARSLFYPRTTDGNSYYCAELVCDILKAGGLISANCNPGAATPESLHALYVTRAACTANPVLLRDVSQVQKCMQQQHPKHPIWGTKGPWATQAAKDAPGAREARGARGAPRAQGIENTTTTSKKNEDQKAMLAQMAIDGAKNAKNVGALRVVAAIPQTYQPPQIGNLQMTLNSLDMRVSLREQRQKHQHFHCR
jgi:hypothetical protein